MKELVTLSRREVLRRQVLEQVKKGVLSLKAAAGACRLSGAGLE